MVFLSTQPMVSLHCRSSYFVDVANLGLDVCLCVCVWGGGFHLYRCIRLYPPTNTHVSTIYEVQGVIGVSISSYFQHGLR